MRWWLNRFERLTPIRSLTGRRPRTRMGRISWVTPIRRSTRSCYKRPPLPGAASQIGSSCTRAFSRFWRKTSLSPTSTCARQHWQSTSGLRALTHHPGLATNSTSSPGWLRRARKARRRPSFGWSRGGEHQPDHVLVLQAPDESFDRTEAGNGNIFEASCLGHGYRRVERRLVPEWQHVLGDRTGVELVTARLRFRMG